MDTKYIPHEFTTSGGRALENYGQRRYLDSIVDNIGWVPRSMLQDILYIGNCVWCGNKFIDDGTGACNSCYGPRDGNLWQR